METLKVPTKLSEDTSALVQTHTQDPSSLAFHLTQILIKYLCMDFTAWVFTSIKLADDCASQRKRSRHFGSYTSGLF